MATELTAIWRAGQRVSRKDSGELGVIIDAVDFDNDRIFKVKWDGGKTIYFFRDRPGNVRQVRAESVKSTD